MKVAWANLKNQNKYLLIDKKKQENGGKVTVKLACDKNRVAAAECSQSFSESD